MATLYPKLLIGGGPRSETSWTTPMIGKHPDVLAGKHESPAYVIVAEPFSSVPELKFSQRLNQARQIHIRYAN